MTRAATTLALCLMSSAAVAQGLDAERFAPAISADGGFVLEQPTVPFHLGWGLGLFLTSRTTSSSFATPRAARSRADRSRLR